MQDACKYAAILILPFGPDDSGLGYPEFALPSTYNINVSCPTLTVSTKSAARLIDLVKIYPNLTATIDKDDGISPVRQWLTSGLYWFFSIFSAASSCFVAAYAVVKLYEYCYCSGHPVFSVVGICILFELCGSLIRFANWSIDSLGARHLTTQHGSGSWRSASLPFTVASTLLLTFYWHETLSRTSLRVSLNIGRFKIPCYILIVLCFVVEIAIDTIRLTLHNISNFWRSINAVFYVIVAAGLSVFYIITAARIFIALKKSTASTAHNSNMSSNSTSGMRKENRRLNALRNTTIKLLGSGIFLAIMVIVAPTSLLPYYAAASMSHVGYAIFWIVAHFLVNGKAITTLAAFPTASRRGDASTSRRSTMSDKSLSAQSAGASHVSADT
eukprot:TRINITY_DN1281_c0_g1_i3.p1 TRINITY_DN1281_c0_g1~~TRINITY_DN1281_c0_g1_i3.p1  ORF type:complete len:386 (+),score=29.55 TRINITY_DN1281_c0_g1_i3:445-1602(+)